MSLPLDVGTLDTGFFDFPIHTSHIKTMHWSDADNGHLGGSAFVIKLTSGGGGSATKVYRTVDYLTTDGGATWRRTDLGTIVFDITGGNTPQHDGVTTDGFMRSFYDGLMVGELRSTWGYESSCTGAGDCPPDYTCSTAGACEPPVTSGACNPPCGFDERCDNGNCKPAGSTGTGSGGNTSSGGGIGFDDGGCNCTTAPARGGATLVCLILGLLGVRWRRRGAGAIC
ncbi:MAG: hypothetical protein V3T05_13335 [Myxococcota bacterium]